ncbi:MAG: hypothetical protein AAF355_09980 [Myxococcota bacterium]
MPISEAGVAAKISEISNRLADPSYTQLAVAHFIESQPHASRYLSLRLEQEGPAQLMHAVFHAEVIVECLREGFGREVGVVDFEDLDSACRVEDSLLWFHENEPALASYLQANIDSEPIQECLRTVGIALVRTVSETK